MEFVIFSTLRREISVDSLWFAISSKPSFREVICTKFFLYHFIAVKHAKGEYLALRANSAARATELVKLVGSGREPDQAQAIWKLEMDEDIRRHCKWDGYYSSTAKPICSLSA